MQSVVFFSILRNLHAKVSVNMAVFRLARPLLDKRCRTSLAYGLVNKNNNNKKIQLWERLLELI